MEVLEACRATEGPCRGDLLTVGFMVIIVIYYYLELNQNI